MQSVHPTEGESSGGIPASPSSARRGRPVSDAEDGVSTPGFHQHYLLDARAHVNYVDSGITVPLVVFQFKSIHFNCVVIFSPETG